MAVSSGNFSLAFCTFCMCNGLVKSQPCAKSCWQDPPALDSWLAKPWNRAGTCDMKTWLVASQDAEAKSRMKVMCNIVVPQQAAMAAAILANILKLEF